ncbi:MAG: GIY-YIG nuclease family protein [Caulobacteraceae bacterium]
MTRRPFIAVYMMTNRRHGTLYIGVTANLMGRVGQHREGAVPLPVNHPDRATQPRSSLALTSA